MDTNQQNQQKSPDLIDVLSLTAKRVVDIGCGSVKLQKNFTCEAHLNIIWV